MSFRWIVATRGGRFAVLGAGVVLLYAVRILGLHQSFYQDELDWVVGVSTTSGFIPHPPVSEFLYQTAQALVGAQNLRVAPFVFGALAMAMLWLVVRRRVGERAAWWAAGLFGASFYSVLASLMVDTDGQWMPLLFIAALYCADRFMTGGRHALRWLALGAFVLAVGLSTKFSFALPAFAIGADMLLAMRDRWRRPSLWLWAGALTAAILGIVALGIRFGYLLVPGYSTELLESYTSRFFTLERRWIQIVIQTVKAVLYLSPALVAPVLLMRRERWTKLRPFFLYVIAGLFFYLVLFDFSAGALDRYLALLIIPLSAIAGTIIADALDGYRLTRATLAVTGTYMVLLIVVPFLHHAIPPHYPKTAWFAWVLQGHWMFLLPFTGGSGPLGFYVSWMLIGLSWLMSLLAVCAVWGRKVSQGTAIIIIIGISLVYNIVFTEEYLWGGIHGSAQRLMRDAVAYIAATPSITRVITYNDIGAYELRGIGKYERRLYAAPKFEDSYTGILRSYRGHWLVIDVPRINEASVYGAYFRACRTQWRESDGAVTAAIYQCTLEP